MSRRALLFHGTAKKAFMNASLVTTTKEAKSGIYRFTQMPERLKGTFVDRWATYWKDLFRDYYEVFKDVGTDLKNKPVKSGVIFTLSGLSYFCWKNNPDMNDFRSAVMKHSNEFIFIGPKIRNPKTTEHLNLLEQCTNEGTLRRFSFGLFSFIWRDNYSDTVGIYSKWCPYLTPEWLSFHTRVLDVGFLNKWWILEEKMVDCDINPGEWGDTIALK
ncbi:mitochondrial import inner membrane translocase subunit Tim29 isoform X2 [Cimex lectularius]|nr:mitochondrial import inner membrane translocase subunit Tim29 isoform X2 [Cimex lectularius]